MICVECSNNFSRRPYIDGKQRYLSRRTKCYECSPFDKNSSLRRTSHEVTCKNCSKVYAPERGKSSLTLCNSCRVHKNDGLVKKKAIDYKGGKCQSCGYNKYAGALSFHHRDPSEKKFVISASYTRAWVKIEKELDKCDLLCLNCHAEHHGNLGG